MSLTPDDINKKRDSAESFINSLVDDIRNKRWGRLLALLGVVSLLFLNPAAISFGLSSLKLRPPDWSTPVSYFYIWLVVVFTSFIGAFLTALLTKKQPISTTILAPTSIIKGLVPYTKEDAEWFAKLQRGDKLNECMNFCLGAGSSFAILSGDSGVGKTSFLQAGLLPNLEKKGLHPIYVKFTDSQPLDAIRQALNLQADAPSVDEHQSLVDLLRKITRDDTRPLVLIFDQFEQFFAHNKTKPSRQPFVREMVEWNDQSSSLPVKILISIRDDFISRLNEFQTAMKYALTPYNNISIEKFDPDAAAKVIGVIAREAEIELDESFVKELTKNELASRNDGAVSPVDVQLLFRMIVGQKKAEDRAFNRKTFQKLGGVDGSLRTFLEDSLGALKPNPRLQQSAIKVMLAMTDGNVRTSALSLKNLKERLNRVVSAGDVDDALSWLTNAEVRLVTPVKDNNITLYELAHERIIPPLRRLASKTISDKGEEEARQTLERRVNEWLGNNCSRRYLLTFSEWRLINHYRAVITSGLQKAQKEEFFSRSKQRLLTIGVGFTVIVLLGFGGYVSYRLWERRPETQIYYAQKRLGKLLDGNKDVKATKYASFLLPSLEDNIDQELSHKLRQKIAQLEPALRTVVLGALAEAYMKSSKTADAVSVLDEAQKTAEQLPPPDQALVLLSLIEAYHKLGMNDKALDVFNKTQQVIERLDVYDLPGSWPLYAEAYGKLLDADKAVELLEGLQPRAVALGASNQAIGLRSLAGAYSRLSNTDRAVKGLSNVRQAAEKLESAYQVTVLLSLVEAYSSLPNTAEARKGLDHIHQAAKRLDSYKYNDLSVALILAHSRLEYADEAAKGVDKALQMVEGLYPEYQVKSLLSLVEIYSSSSNIDEALKGLDTVQQAAEKLDPHYQIRVQLPLAEAYSSLSNTDKALKSLDKVRQAAETLTPSDQAFVLISAGEAYNKLEKADEALKELSKAQQMGNMISSNEKSLLLVKVATLYAKLSKWREAREAAESIGDEVYAISALSQILIIWIDTKTGAENMNALEELFQEGRKEDVVFGLGKT